jgi:aminoglycoside/choline kinase family phosphotransferase
MLDAAGLPILERYEAAIDLLVHMHGQDWPAETPLPGGGSYRLPAYDREALLIEASLFADWHGRDGAGPAIPTAARADFLAAWSGLLDRIEPVPPTWVLRDFHSPNLLWQAGETGIRRVGVLDFQDALIGHPAYDVASLAQDARAPLTEEQERRLKLRYLAARRSADARFDAAAFEIGYRVLGLQRATKVLGAFTRLALAEGKPGYGRYRARLAELIHRNLAHPVLSPLRVWYEPYL